MRIDLEFGDERLEIDAPDERVVGVWQGPRAVPSSEVARLVRDALEAPLDYPPLRQAVVPGDQVVLPVDPDLPGLSGVLDAVCQVLQAAGVDAGSIRVLAAGTPGPAWSESLPQGVAWATHDPEDRSQLAYLASTAQGRRIYLNRYLTDADSVIPVGWVGYDPVLGYRGPWSVMFPGLSDTETQRAYRAQASDSPSDRDHPRPALAESTGVSWLLGSQFHVGILPGVGGLARALAGIEEAVRKAAIEAVDSAWTWTTGGRAGLVVTGIGLPGTAAGIDELAEGLATAARLVQPGGKIAVLSRAGGPIGPALSRLIEADRPRPSPAILRGLEGEADYPAARQIALALAKADIYLLSSLAEDQVDDLGMVALGRPEEVRRLVATSESCLFVSQADRTRALVAEKDEADRG